MLLHRQGQCFVVLFATSKFDLYIAYLIALHVNNQRLRLVTHLLKYLKSFLLITLKNSDQVGERHTSKNGESLWVVHRIELVLFVVILLSVVIQKRNALDPLEWVNQTQEAHSNRHQQLYSITYDQYLKKNKAWRVYLLL